MQNAPTQNLQPNLEEDDFRFKQETARRARLDFVFFFNTVFSISLEIIEGEFVRGDWLDEFGFRLQNKNKTCTLAARKHGKTTLIAGFVCWLIFRSDIEEKLISEYLYIMYSDELACEKIKRIKQYIQCNEYFKHIKDLKSTAEGIIEYLNNRHIVSVKPAGVGSFKRGKHPDGVICDDILRDPTKSLDLSQIEKVTQIFEAEITSLPREGGFLHLVGTSQDQTDIMFKLQALEGWDWSLNAAIKDRNKKLVLWPDKFPFERLLDIELNETGKKNFQREYQLIPMRATEGFFSRGEIEARIDKQLENHTIYKPTKETFDACYAGADLGKKRHPSHLAILEALPDNDIIYLIQRASIWFDGTDYTDQLAAFAAAIKKFGIVSFYWDNTRAEFDGFHERGELPEEMTPFCFTAGGKEKIASEFDKQVGNKRIILLNDERQTRSILSVDGSLKAPDTAEGHGDAFWSVSLAVQAFIDNNIPSFV